jgi:TadE-like protein
MDARADAPTGRNLLRSSGGAVYVEFLIAFMPFFVFFLCLWQLSILFYATLVVDHAAFAAARAAAVVAAECPRNVGDTDPFTVNTLTEARKKHVKAAAYVALTPLILDGTLGVDDVVPIVQYPDKLGGVDLGKSGIGPSFEPMTPTSVSNVRVRVNAMFICKIAIANALVCNGLTAKLSGGVAPASMPLSAEGVFPFQGATYTYASTCE